MLPIEQNLESQTHGTELTIGFGATDVWIFLLERSYDFGRALENFYDVGCSELAFLKNFYNLER
jgi:hypothetical protein